MVGIELLALIGFLSATAGYLFGLAQKSSKSVKLDQKFTEAMFHAAIVHGLNNGIIELTEKGIRDESERDDIS